ncbi:MAG: PmeII family type II restriction endonuclease, partial [Adlercreutzia equolifaciens]
KDVIMFAARGVATAEEFVLEAFRACESSSEETVMGNLWQALIAAISSDTLDTGDMMTVRDGALYVCELKSQVNTTNSASFPQELRELKDKCETQRRFKRASNQQVLPAFCVLRHNKAIDEIRTYQPDERDQANRDIAGFQYRYLTGRLLAMAYRFRLVEGLSTTFPSRSATSASASRMHRPLQEEMPSLEETLATP